MGHPLPPAAPLVEAIGMLRDTLAATPLDLEVGGSAESRRERAAVIGQVDDYLLPRLVSLNAPLLTVVGGSTGAGKSTLVNALVGTAVTTAGVLRPTTRAPVLVCHPEDRAWFADDRVLPKLARTTGAAAAERDRTDDAPTQNSLRLVTAAEVPRGLALLDAPDVDSVVTANRELAAQLLAAADLWLFVTTAARYADAVPWALLHTAQERSTALAMVLDRVAPEAVAEVAAHLREMLTRNGLGDAQLFVVPETELVNGALPAASVAPVRRWLADLGADAGRRQAVVRTTLEGALDSLSPRVEKIAAQADTQRAAAATLLEQVDEAYTAAGTEVDRALRDGSLLRGEVLNRWQEFVGTGEFMRSLESKIGRFRDRLKAAFTGRPTPEAELRDAVESGVEALVLDAADRAAERSVEGWQVHPAGKALLTVDGGRGLGRSSPELRARLAAEIRDWQGHVLALVAEEGADKRTAARVASLGVNGAGLAVMIGVFAHTGGLTGGEVAVAGGTGVAGQRLLEAVFGDQAVRTLAREARIELVNRVDDLLTTEAARFAALLPTATDSAGSRLRAALAAVGATRRRSAELS
jgi:energy-coupling factor transporter ATP-binding protein EcfA2